jgi:hypothetical protein
MAGAGGREPLGEVFFELTRIGAQVRVAALHVASGTEVVVVAPAAATQPQMQALALAKLRKRLAEQSAG